MKVNMSVFENFPVLKTKRLTLREFLPEDAESIYKMRSNARVGQFIARPLMTEKEAAQQLAEKTIEGYKDKKTIAWAGILRDGNHMIGACGFNNIDFDNLRAEIGGELDVQYWGKNIAFEAVEAIVRFGFETMQLHSIEAKVDPGNRGAIFLLQQLGFEKEAHYKDRVKTPEGFIDMAVYSKVQTS